MLFIDRDPDLFSIVLQAVRSNRPPPREVVSRFGLFEIMETARYFCVDWLAEVLSGKLVHSAVPQKFANILAEEAVARKQLDEGVPVDSTDLVLDVHKIENVFSEDLSVDWGESLLF